MFEIKASYRENPKPCYFLDDVTDVRGIVFQPDVYTFAELLAEVAGLPSIVDVGCGYGGKLAAIHDRHPDWCFLGVDYGANLEHCRALYPWGDWLEQDLEAIGGSAIDAHASVLICSDVIEHLADPRPLVAALRGSGAELIVLSTPERDVQYGYDHEGPPPNLCHIREWSAGELKAFLEGEGLRVRHVGLTRGSDQGWPMATTIVVAQP